MIDVNIKTLESLTHKLEIAQKRGFHSRYFLDIDAAK